MSRYLIIDTEKINLTGLIYAIEGMHHQSGVILSEEESLEKFKEIFTDGYIIGVDHGRIDMLDIKHAWNESETLKSKL